MTVPGTRCSDDDLDDIIAIPLSGIIFFLFKDIRQGQ